MPDSRRTRTLVRLRQEEDHLTVEVDFEHPLPIGLLVHKGARDAVVRSLIGKSGGRVTSPGRACSFPLGQRRTAEALAERLRASLHQVASKPLSPKQVERLLSLTGAERSRWSKDGRLQRSGTATIRRGSSAISLSTYNVDAVERLLEAPEIVEGWRRSDRGS